MFSADPFGQLKDLQKCFGQIRSDSRKKTAKHEVFRTTKLGVRANTELGVRANVELGVRANAKLGVIANVRTLQKKLRKIRQSFRKKYEKNCVSFAIAC